MPKSDHEYFNCSEEHELQYVSGLYVEKDEVYQALKTMCANNTINNSTHAEVYELLDRAGFTRK